MITVTLTVTDGTNSKKFEIPPEGKTQAFQTFNLAPPKDGKNKPPCYAKVYVNKGIFDKPEAKTEAKAAKAVK